MKLKGSGPLRLGEPERCRCVPQGTSASVATRGPRGRKENGVFFKDFIYLFLERWEVKEKERERNVNVQLPLKHPLLGTWPATQACALTGNRTSDPLICRLALNPPSHTSEGRKNFWKAHLYTQWSQRAFLNIKTSAFETSYLTKIGTIKVNSHKSH